MAFPGAATGIRWHKPESSFLTPLDGGIRVEINRNGLLVEYLQSLHFSIVDSGYARVGTDWNMARVRSPYTRLYYVLEGEGILSHEGRETRLTPGCACLIPSQFQYDCRCDTVFGHLFFHLNLVAADGHDLLGRMSTCRTAEVGLDAVEAVLSAYRGETVADALRLWQAIHAQVASFLAETSVGEAPCEMPSAFLEQVYSLARQSVDARTTVAALAERMAVSPGALSRRFRAETGQTPARYLDGLLLQQAQQLLLSSDDTIGRIAERLGFCDQFYFSRWFRQHRQETPSGYRQRLREPYRDMRPISSES